MDVSNKIILVVGGSSGIGAACVRNFSLYGSKIIFCSNDEKNGKILEKEICNENVKFIFCDVTHENNIVSVVDFVLKTYGEKLDCLINNVGYHPEDRKIDNFSSEDFDTLFKINARSYFLFSKYCLPLIRKSKGCIINISSQVASMGQRHAVTYAATKGAILAMSKSLALDEAENGVRVNSVSPGIIDTPLLVQNTIANVKIKGDCTYDGEIEKMKTMIPLGDLGTGTDVANVCLFLASDMAKYLTGCDIPVTGGIELGYGVKSVKLTP